MDTKTDKKLRALAVYLPQFHPIPENDKWWGKGFTEWTNVVKGKKIIKGQYQPHIPADLGFYDLRLPEIREQQAKMAQENGIHGFCYYHYWFNGKRVLERPLNEVLESGKPDFPFCLCWANEDWSRNWDGRSKDILLKQDYSNDDDRNHIRYLCENVFNDSRYITVDGKPVFMIYRPSLFPDMRKTIEVWREEVLKYGFKGIYLGFFWSFEYGVNPDKYGFDFASLFPSNLLPVHRSDTYFGHLMRMAGIKLTVKQKYLVYDYKKIADYCKQMDYPSDYTLYPSIFPMWDNYVRRRNGGGKIVINSTPELYEDWLGTVCEKWNPPTKEENFIFLNAWNEWAEGNHLEPCQRWGSKYLEATKRALRKFI
jgi:lipopolysaccharide biosynthesis protein